METNQYLSMFIEESKEHLQAINETLLKLEEHPSEISLVQIVFRSAHTLKGMSATMGFEDMASLTHEMENVLDMVRNGQKTVTSSLLDVLFRGVDSLEGMIYSIIDGGSGKADVSVLVKQLREIASGQAEEKAASSTSAHEEEQLLDEYQLTVLKQSVEAGHKAYVIDVTLSEGCILKAARAYMVYNRLEQDGEILKSTPSVDDIEQEKFDSSFQILYISTASNEHIEQAVSNISEVHHVSVVPFNPSLANSVEGREVIQLTAAATETIEAPASASPEKAISAAPEVRKQAMNKTIRVDIEKLDVLMNLFSELVIDRGRIEQLSAEIGRTDLIETTEHLSRITGHLQNLILKLRMVQIEQVFNRFPRMIRDLARDLNKKVDLIISGADTELDRTVVDEIGDPLVHMLRNAVDHGLETTEGRIAAGKPEAGRLSLRAFHSGNQVFIEIEDDGKGINREAVLRKAIENKVVSQEQAALMNDSEVYMLLFASGFSTAETISDISGRGVGLDVVKSKIESLGGSVQVDSQLGKGTKFSVQLPLTLSIISAMLFRLGEEKYAIPLSSIVETALWNPDEISHIHNEKMINFRGKMVPVLSLRNYFDVPGEKKEQRELELIIIQKGERMGAIVVDSFIGQQEIVIKPLGNYFDSLSGISGATILGDGQVALIIDPNSLIK